MLVSAGLLSELGVFVLEAVGDVFKENETEDGVLVLRRTMLLRSLSAASQSLASKPRLAVELAFEEERLRGMSAVVLSGSLGKGHPKASRSSPVAPGRSAGQVLSPASA